MKVVHWSDCEDKQIDKFPYKGDKLDVTFILATSPEDEHEGTVTEI